MRKRTRSEVKKINVKIGSSVSSSLSTSFIFVSRAFSSRTPTMPKSGGNLDSRLKANGHNPDDIDEQLMKLRDEGKTFKEIHEHLNQMTGEKVTIMTWYNRYERIKQRKRNRTQSGSDHLEHGVAQTRKRWNRGLDSPDDDGSNQLTGVAHSRIIGARQSRHTSTSPKLRSAPAIHSNENGDELCSRASTLAVSRDLPTSLEEADEPDKLLFRLKSIENKSWPEIRKA